MKLSVIVAAWQADIPAGMVISVPAVSRLLKDAVRFYCGYATLTLHPSARELLEAAGSAVPAGTPVHSPVDGTNAISSDQDFDLTASETAIILPLWKLYMERENAMNLEASRALGLDVYGRTVSEVAQAIEAMENELPRKAFFEPIFTV